MFHFIPIAYASSHIATSQGLVDKINSAILFPLIALMMALAFIIFLWGAFEYVKNANNEAARETGRNHLMYGVIGMLIMLSAFAILSIAAGTFGIDVPTSSAPTTSLRPQARPDRSPVTSLRPQARPDRSPVTSLRPQARPDPTQCYSFNPNCGPSVNPNVYDAFYEEYRVTGGASLGSTNLMAVQTYLKDEQGSPTVVLEAVAELREFDYLSEETYRRVVSEVNDIATKNQLVNDIGAALDNADAEAVAGP